jgi:predicted AAA+ superfamily ATPase
VEVDLVLKDGRDRLVGVEVKVTTSVGRDDLVALRALRRARGLHRGFVVYRGGQVFQVDDDIWAVPARAFVTGTAFGPAPAARENGC